jgi:hypothetical protein
MKIAYERECWWTRRIVLWSSAYAEQLDQEDHYCGGKCQTVNVCHGEVANGDAGSNKTSDRPQAIRSLETGMRDLLCMCEQAMTAHNCQLEPSNQALSTLTRSTHALPTVGSQCGRPKINISIDIVGICEDRTWRRDACGMAANGNPLLESTVTL